MVASANGNDDGKSATAAQGGIGGGGRGRQNPRRAAPPESGGDGGNGGRTEPDPDDDNGNLRDDDSGWRRCRRRRQRLATSMTMVALRRGFKTLAIVLSAAGPHFCAASSSAPQEPHHNPLLAGCPRPSARGQGAPPHHPGDAGDAWKPVLAAVHDACVEVLAACAIRVEGERGEGGGICVGPTVGQ
uniref:Uncharacterized protein n=1 Tax=Oryza nivara TaxID=4536 RepID=A0A0E0J743_ORYNI